MNPPFEAILHGGHPENDNQKILTAGSLSMIYENGNLRGIRNSDKELIRMIYMAVRDRDWLTAIPVISDEKIIQNESGFRITYSARYQLGDIDFAARFSLSGNQDNQIEISFSGEALSTFYKNRIGFCVLHAPEEIAGNKCTIIHPDGRKETSVFPRFISPHQLFNDISGMKWKCNGINCTLEFHGDIFETEDQRNWTDASYKTYSTPLSIPYPVRIEKGWKTSQKIIFKAEPYKITSESAIEFSIDIFPAITRPVPSIGICRTTRKQPVTNNEIQILKKIRFSHYRTELYLFEPDWTEIADLAVIECTRLEYPSVFALFFSANFRLETEHFLTWFQELHHPVAAIMLFHKDHDHTPDEILNHVTTLLKNALPGTTVISGTNANFAQLNRHRPESKKSDGYCWSVHPQEHASDNLTLTENIEGQYETLISARQFLHSGKLWVSPVNLMRRFNANSENYEMPFRGNTMPPRVDTRIMSLFGAGWTAGSLKYLSEGGADAITYFETAGERGIIQGDFDPAWKEFPASRGMIFPVYHVFRFISDRNISGYISSKSSHPLLAESFIFTDRKKMFGILSNLSASQRVLNINGAGENFRIKIMDSSEYLLAAEDPGWLSGEWMFTGKKIKLPPFSLSFVEF